jgi:peptidoglycan/xylan/chitin deacetylase (PgdA/CDA1 family)
MIRNFLFHRVSPERDALWDPMDVALFDRCIKYISNKYKVVLFEDLAFNDNDLSSRNEIATIMFDDGYKDNIEHALPILEKYNVKASFYVVTDCIDNNIPTWTHVLEYSFQNTDKSELDLPFDFLPVNLRSGKFQGHADKLRFAAELKPYLKGISHTNREIVLEKVNRDFSDVSLPQLMMSWDDVRTLRDHGHYIGSHTVTHCMLGTMTDESLVEEELQKSAKRIEQELGYYPLTISYPVGSYNEATKRISKNVGYKIGLAVKQNIFDPRNEDLFEVSRIELYNEPWYKTKMRISNRLENIKKIIRYK